MAYTKVWDLTDIRLNVFNPVLGTPTGTRVSVLSPVRGQILECGFAPASLVASAMTLQVATDPHPSSNTSTFTTVITSTLGTFSSTALFEGAAASVVPASPTFVNPGDAILFTCSGGNTSAIGGTLYVDIRRN